jgi:hypothetical protein
VMRWSEIVGAEISAHCEPIKIQWPRAPAPPSPASGVGSGWAGSRTGAREREWSQAPGTLVLRVEGPAAIEIQHLTDVICERVNRFLGWRAIARIALRQAPLRRAAPRSSPAADAAAAARIAGSLPEIADEELRQALARLGAAVGQRR